MIDTKTLTIKSAIEGLSRGDFSARELCEAYLSVAQSRNPELNAYLEIFDDALDSTKEIEKKIKDGNTLPLAGVPLAVKDNILIKGKRASSASKVLEGFVAPYDATVISKLREAGAVFLGRTNMDEFAMGSSTENSAFGPTKNPIDTSRVPGGSSGGSVAAVAAGMALGALGSETGGSIRQPASFCGVVGLKTTYGSVSRYGLMALGSSLDQIGPVAKTVTDAEILFNAIRGIDKMDSTSYWEDNIQKGEVKRIGVPRHLIEVEGVHMDVAANFSDSLKKLEDLGYEIVDVELPNAHLALAVYYIIMPAEASSNLARYDGIKYGLSVPGENLLEGYLSTRREGFGAEPRRRILLGTYVLSSGYYDAYYSKANMVRALIRKDFDEAYKKVDAIVLPTTPTPAFKIGEKANDPLAMYLADIFTVSANIAGIPALSVPSGFSKEGSVDLPLGIQFLGSHYSEGRLFEIGKKFLGESR